jgi:hypothetical protein
MPATDRQMVRKKAFALIHVMADRIFLNSKTRQTVNNVWSGSRLLKYNLIWFNLWITSRILRFPRYSQWQRNLPVSGALVFGDISIFSL